MKGNKVGICFSYQRRSFSNRWDFWKDEAIVGIVQRSYAWHVFGRITTHESYSASWCIYFSWFRKSFHV